ncbi:hypothetical protein VQ7734_03412 [Vibrio quintilis]|uniref:Uncharacterized protein n=1 Tax=Vibrio quintilis TaxID=1117707 RepID=A0A1M7YYJ7_9VIBR|nr:hypothetical protein VQ7734_03412 [Vibrio quintilis]
MTRKKPDLKNLQAKEQPGAALFYMALCLLTGFVQRALFGLLFLTYYRAAAENQNSPTQNILTYSIIGAMEISSASAMP